MADNGGSHGGSPVQPLAGRIISVNGRQSDQPGMRRGLRPVEELEIDIEGVGVKVFRAVGPTSEEPGTVLHGRAFLTANEPFRFSVCPICLKPGDLTEEHVPAHGVGGRHMTWTCGECNSNLGRFEADLKNWFDDALVGVRFRSDAIPGWRAASRHLTLRADDGTTVLLAEGTGPEPGLGTILGGSNAEMSFRRHDEARLGIAFLKNAYLGACIVARSIPESAAAAGVRADLLAARDWKKREPFPESERAAALVVSKANRPRTEPAVAQVAVVDAEQQIHGVGIAFGGTLFVSWPLEPEDFDALAATWKQQQDRDAN